MIGAEKETRTDAGEEERRLDAKKEQTDQSGPHGGQPPEIAERTNGKRQKMNEQDNQ
jgi:hypothetical protein